MKTAARAARWQPAYIGLGSNLDDPARQVKLAIDACARLPNTKVVSCSRLYISKPFGPIEQADFVNAVVGAVTQLTPEQLLVELRRVETLLGRKPGQERWGPRRIDLDLLVLGQERRVTASLQVPHPGLAERDFVLYPLNDIAPHLEIAGLGRVRDLFERVPNRGLEPQIAMTTA